ncbi:MAG: SLBB domain-containing protein [Candidatus Obscuribacterales bacterium]|nr:SLBB domain-containing protein [Candidatus Obscuribacterales bacterium]
MLLSFNLFSVPVLAEKALVSKPNSAGAARVSTKDSGLKSSEGLVPPPPPVSLQTLEPISDPSLIEKKAATPLIAANKKSSPQQKLVPPPPAVPLLTPDSGNSKKKSSKQILQTSDDSPTETKEVQAPEAPQASRRSSSRITPYALGPGDLLTVVDPSLGTDEVPYEKDIEVAPDGTVSVYPIGTIQAEGLTVGELTQVINNKEKSIVDQPQVVVMLKKARPVHVHVLGEVVSPGLYSNLAFGASATAASASGPNIGPLQNTNTADITGLRLSAGVTLSATDKPPKVGDLTVLTAIQLAGGVKSTADIRNIQLSRAGESEPRKVDLERMLVEGDFSQDLTLRSGDNIYVPMGGSEFLASKLGAAVQTPRPVRIIGEVNRPGLYYLGPNDDLVTILSKAGGFDVIAKQRSVLLSRMNHDGTVTTRNVNVKAALRNSDKAGRLEVMPGDVVIVNASFIRRIAPLVGYATTVAGVFTLLSVISAALPATFMNNITRGNTGQNVGNAFFGLGYSNGLLFGTGQRAGVVQAIP